MVRNGYQHMVHDYYVEKVRSIVAKREEELRNIKTSKEARRYQRKVLRFVNRVFSPRPAKTPLNARITGVVERPHHRIEKILFESRPGFLVTANLYLPKSLKEPAPGVIAPCGHSKEGKAFPTYQAFCQRLVRAGFIVLIYDPLNQGERDQYYRIKDSKLSDNCCFAHNMMGKQLELLGEFFGMWRTWDGIRALDYLLTRPEVDPKRIGVTGNSGGGTLSEWLWAVDNRFSMAAPSCFVTTFLSNLENEEPQDCEQYPPGLLGEGFEMVDLMIARAPKPAMLLGQAHDFFDRRGLLKAYQDLRRFYKILGEPDAVQLFIGPHGHGYHKENQEAMVKFFVKHAGLDHVEAIDDIEVLDERTLCVTAEGNTIAAGARPIFELMEEKATLLASKRETLDLGELKEVLRKILGVSLRRKLPHYRVLRPENHGERDVARYAIETDENIRVILRKPVTEPEKAYSLDVENEIHLYLPHISAEQDIEEYAKDGGYVGKPTYALDPRGLGESIPEGGVEEFFHPYGFDYMFHGFGLLLSESYLGRRVHDILLTMDLLGHEGADTIHLYGRGQGAILALFSAILHPLAGKVTLKNGPRSYEEWVHVPVVEWPASNFPRGILKFLDLPDCFKILGNRVAILDPWGPDMRQI
ncbi:MAG: alpha/beta hydrolase family protein [Thermoproteota archaeon]